MSEPTRRDWVLSIGRAGAGMALAWSGGCATTSSSAPLPPGVYLPSKDHLGHALMSADRYHPVPPGCPTDYIRPSQAPYQPIFFTQAEFAFCCCFAKLLLGDVPEAVSQESAEWIDLYIASEPAVRKAEAGVDSAYKALAAAYFGSNQKSQAAREPGQTFRDGFAWISNDATTRYGKEFVSLEPHQQFEILHAVADDRENPSIKNAGAELFTLLKTEVIRGFYTSRFGLKELDYKGNAFYARSPGCPSN